MDKKIKRFVKAVCAGGIDPGWDECPICGATSDDECKFAAKPMTTFTVGQKVKILDDRRCHWQPSEEMTILAIEELNDYRHQLLITDKGEYADYWFDPTQSVLKHLDKVKNIE